MPKYIVVKDFTDLQDNDHVYKADDQYPREGVKVTDDRIKELSSTDNKRKEVLIKEQDDYSALTVKELQDIAKEREIEGYSKLKKDELIEALKG